MIKNLCRLFVLSLLLGTTAYTAKAQNLKEFEKNVTEFTLDNGFTFIVVKRPVAPVVSFMTHVNVGGVDEPVGQTGIAHIFEHMAFKGTHYIGTNDWDTERPLLEKIDATYTEWLYEKFSPKPDTVKMAKLWAEFQQLEEEAKKLVKNNEFSQIIEKNGGSGLNAFTSSDATGYFYSLPSNRTELWFSLEADRFKRPVFREFYVEKEVIREERNMRTESNPTGRLIEEFLAVAYTAHPYGRPVVGWNSDITATTMADARKFFETYYVPKNIAFSVVGDVDPKEIRRLAETYFGDVPKAPAPPPVTTLEPAQRGERRFEIIEKTQPFLLLGWHTVSDNHPDAQALNLLSNILSGGRTSRFYKRMVEKDQSALAAQAINGFPGTRYAGMFLALAVPNQGVDVESLIPVMEEEIDKAKQGDITQAELDRVRTQIRASTIRGLGSNSGLAQRLATAQNTKGDWRTIFTDLDELQKVTLDDLKRVANTYLVNKNRTIGIIKTEDAKKEVADAK